MAETPYSGDFLNQARAIVLDEIANEQFGVSELADAMNMSRSSLLRKVKRQTDLSASQFIRNIRLDKAKELLAKTELTVSEISFQVGFSNSSYFIKCYREYFGHPPGEARKIIIEKSKQALDIDKLDKKQIKESKSFLQMHLNKIIALLTIVIIAVISFQFGAKGKDDSKIDLDKSIAVLPFKNMSSDSSNLYFINGLMEASLSNLQKIKDLRVISRTSVEKYSNTQKTVSEIAKELNVNYLVEGSGQKIGDEVLLNIQLIDASTDSPIWTDQYKHTLVDIFTLQNTVAKKIALAIEANVTPEELALIDKRPTENIKAYDYYLKGLDSQRLGGENNLLNSISLFEEAIKEDEQFAMAYAQIAISYYYLDMRKMQKLYLDKLNENADKALLHDSKSDLSLIAKSLYYLNNGEANLAIPHLEKALEYNPNSSSVVLILSDLYARVVPNTEKYLKYALKGIQLNLEANDSIGKGFIFLHLSNALVQTGFVDESLEYINKSLEFYPENPFAEYVKVYIELAIDGDMDKAIFNMTKEYEKDTTRADIIQELAKLYYFQEQYGKSYEYYVKYEALISNNAVDIYPHEKLRRAIVYEKMGEKNKAQELLEGYNRYLDNDNSIYKPASMAVKYLYEGNLDAAMDQFKLFATKSNFQYWIVLFIEKDPLLEALKSHKDYENTIGKIKDQFWKDHQKIKRMLEVNDLL